MSPYEFDRPHGLSAGTSLPHTRKPLSDSATSQQAHRRGSRRRVAARGCRAVEKRRAGGSSPPGAQRQWHRKLSRDLPGRSRALVARFEGHADLGKLPPWRWPQKDSGAARPRCPALSIHQHRPHPSRNRPGPPLLATGLHQLDTITGAGREPGKLNAGGRIVRPPAGSPPSHRRPLQVASRRRTRDSRT